ncbi:toprim domain-containing protein [Aquimonas sp.]|jgi:putative DNA primase/helicase|uniref:DUF7146 domain-containing protein n=1 Tax=Aquimonas sp. TaxID=1872588 RepID=UPI0037C13273
MSHPNREFDRAAWDARVAAARRYAEGNWDRIIRNLAPQLGNVIDAGGKHTSCPHPSHNNQRHGDAMRTYRDFPATGGMVCNTCGFFKDGWAVLRWIHNWTFGETVKAIEGCFSGGQIPAPRPPDPKEIARKAVERAEEDARISARLAALWKGVIPLNQPGADRARLYLESRGISDLMLPVPDIGLHPCLEYFHSKDTKSKPELVGRYPALVYIIRTADGRIGSMQRIYLDPQGNGKVKLPEGMDAKKMMPRRSDRPISGGAYWLDDPLLPVAQVGEGLETAWSARLLTGLPTAVASSDTLLAQMQFPANIKFVAIWADNDPAGIRHADMLIERLREEGRRAIKIVPTYDLGRETIDWNDALQAFGLEGLRSQSFYTRFFASLRQRLSKEGYGPEVLRHVAR